jgi:hypothetical protein
MAALLLTVDESYTTERGLMVLPCLSLQALTQRPEFRNLMQGSRVELRRPDGTRRGTVIVNEPFSRPPDLNKNEHPYTP